MKLEYCQTKCSNTDQLKNLKINAHSLQRLLVGASLVWAFLF